jgi:hypothetical protein
VLLVRAARRRRDPAEGRTWVNAAEIVRRSVRPDLVLKFTYAKTRLTGGDSSWATQAYLENIKAFNGFYEEEPRKTTPLDFVQAFDQLLPSFREHGFGPDFPPVAISPSGELLDGAHRVATAAALGLAVPTVVRDLEAHWNYSFFSTRGQSTFLVFF